MLYRNMEKEEKLEIFRKAKEAYYNGEAIMSDIEFDELESELGLENRAYIGSKSPNYTVMHPFIMGSLSKVQVKADRNGDIDWGCILTSIRKYVGDNEVIITPKYDGCSFEYVNNTGKISISSRGDGRFGKDLSKHLSRHCKRLDIGIYDNYVIRGEVLVDKSVFMEKYSEFTNPRSFVSGILNRKYDDIEDKSVLDDLSIVIYDVRFFDGSWHDVDWTSLISTSLDGLLPKEYMIVDRVGDEGEFINIYDSFSYYRSNRSDFALDGFVIKPTEHNRLLNLDSERPVDCVAVKFLPEIKETVVSEITWQLGKTSEFSPIVVFEPIILDGKTVTKASGVNYGNVSSHGINVGARIKVSLAGDIIPFIYRVVEPVSIPFNIGEGMYVKGCHLMKKLDLVEQMEVDFLASCKSLNVPGIGDKIAKKMFDCLEYKFDHVFYLDEDHIRHALDSGEGKTYKSILKSFEECRKTRNLGDVIASMNIGDCGPKCAEQCARYLVSGNADFSGLSSEGYSWCISAREGGLEKDEESYRVYARLLSVLRSKDGSDNGHEFDKYVNDYDDGGDVGKIKVILTGSPSSFKTKKEFLNAHPEYIETTKFSECQILFTGDLSSTSSKMDKARKSGIEIREY